MVIDCLRLLGLPTVVARSRGLAGFPPPTIDPPRNGEGDDCGIRCFDWPELERPLAFGVDDDFAVFLGKGADIGVGEDIEDQL